MGGRHELLGNGMTKQTSGEVIALKAAQEAKRRHLNIDYTGLEGYPLAPEMINDLNHLKQLNAEEEKMAYDKIITISILDV